MNEREILQMLNEVGAVITDSHFVYASGKHGAVYVNKDAIYPFTRKISRLCLAIAQAFKEDNVQTVIAPAIGGVILSQWTAYHLSEIYDGLVFSVFAEKSEQGDRFVIKRGYEKFVTGKKVLVVEDILTTGGSARKVVEATKAIGGDVVGLGSLCNRGGVSSQNVGDVPKLVSLTCLPFESWPEEFCPLCERGIPINTEFGKGAEFLRRKGKTPSGLMLEGKGPPTELFNEWDMND